MSLFGLILSSSLFILVFSAYSNFRLEIAKKIKGHQLYEDLMDTTVQLATQMGLPEPSNLRKALEVWTDEVTDTSVHYTVHYNLIDYDPPIDRFVLNPKDGRATWGVVFEASCEESYMNVLVRNDQGLWQNVVIPRRK